MTAFIVLGVIQGLTEFLPVSSSGHLVIAQRLLGINSPGVALEIVLHAGTLGAVCLFFFNDIVKALRDKRLIVQILIVTAVTGVIGVAGKDFFEGLFNQPRLVALALGITGVVLVLTRFFGQGTRLKLGKLDALFMGIAQGVSVTPGISRSGSTLAALLLRKVDKETAFRFSFIASIPAVAGAAVLKAREISHGLQVGPGPLAAGFFCSFIVGLGALWLLRKVVVRSRLHWFGYYCIAVSLIGWICL